MLRSLFRQPPGLRAARLAARHGGEHQQTVSVQRVKFYRRKNVVRSFVIGACMGYTCYHIYTSTVISPLIRHLEHEYASLSHKERQELAERRDEEDSSIFVAFPFTTKKIDAAAYKGTDPEWKKFGEISRDKALQERIRNDLAGLVKRAVSNHPIINARIGSNMTLRRYWLDIDFPYRPAPTFEHYGILIDDEGISWASEPVDSLTVQRMNKILWPTAMAESSWAFTSAMVKQHWAEVKRGLGFSTPSNTPDSQLGPPAFGRSNLPSPGRQTPDGTPADGPDSAVNKTAVERESNDVDSGGRTNFLKDMALSHVEGAREMSSGPWMAFRRKLAQTWKATKDYPPRGSIIVSGFVEIETSKGFVLVDVWSNWNPSTEQFDNRSMFMKVRRVQMKVQSPARR